MKDAAIIGAGIAGMATAAHLQARGLSTIVFEAHVQPGGCAGFYRRKGYAFDVGATTLVDFEPGGVGGELFESIGMPPVNGQALPGYVAWLPDRVVTLHRDSTTWAAERLRMFGGTLAHRSLWQLLDRLVAVFWEASRGRYRVLPGGLHQLHSASSEADHRDGPASRSAQARCDGVCHSAGWRRRHWAHERCLRAGLPIFRQSRAVRGSDGDYPGDSRTNQRRGAELASIDVMIHEQRSYILMKLDDQIR